MTELHPFVRRLYRLAEDEDRAALAELRRGFLNPLAPLPYVVPYLRRDATRWEEEALSLVGGLFAIHRKPGRLSLASALAIVARESESVALRFRALLDSAPEDLGVHLRHAVSLVASRDLGVDYDDLLKTVRGWPHEDRWAQRAWARDFWDAQDEGTDTEETTP